MEWSARARSIWGKTDRELHGWMPLVRHLEDTAAVADLLYAHYLPEHLKGCLRRLLNGDDPEVRALLRWLAGVHDIGKCTTEFAAQIRLEYPEVLYAMRSHGLPTGTYIRTTFGHPTLGQVLVEDWLRVFDPAPFVASTYSCIVGGHHGRNPSAEALREARNTPQNLGRDAWPAAQREILDGVAQLSGAAQYLAEWMQRPLPIQAQVVITGLVIMADWIASNQNYFDYSNTAQPDRVENGWARVGLPPSWQPATPARPDDLFRVRFPKLPSANHLQRALIDSASTADAPGLWIVEAPMGVGKTEAALLSAEVLAQRFGLGGVFIGLPTMATANPMFARVLDWLATAVGSDDAAVSLAHGKAGLNDRFRGLLQESWAGSIHDEFDPHPQAMVNSWLRGPKRAGLANFVVGTIDQGLFGALKAKHVALRHLSVAGKVVIIDEAHAADIYMRAYLCRLLTWLGSYHTPVIMMSATLPPDHRDAFLSAYAEGWGTYEPQATDRTDSYPRVSFCDGSKSRMVPVDASPGATTVTVHHLDDSPDHVVSLLIGSLAEGGCAAVICNTVARAQEIHQVLSSAFSGEVELIHSRFLAPERAAREQSLCERLGPRGARPQRLIVVGTQVLEQSLDIDFDILISDLAPIDLLLQRAGRLHRHQRTRPAAVSEPALHLRGVQDWSSEPPRAVSGSRRIYGEASLLRSCAALREHPVIVLPQDIAPLVRIAYAPDQAPPTGWEDAWRRAEQARIDAEDKAIDRAQSYLLAPPALPRNLTGWIDVSAADPDRSEAQGRSQVRDSEDSLEVIVVIRDRDGQLRLPACAPSHADALIPSSLDGALAADNSLARAMATCTLPLPMSMSNPSVVDSVLSALERAVDASGWQSSHWLKGQLVLPFDHDRAAAVGPFQLHYNTETGLTVVEQEKS